MNDTERRFHEAWLGMVQPSEGLVVSVPVLVENQCMAKQPHEVQEALLGCVAESDVPGKSERTVAITDLSAFLSRVLALPDSSFDSGDQLPKPLRLYVPEGKQEIRPSRALRRRQAAPAQTFEGADLPAAAMAGREYLALQWEVPIEVDLDRPEVVTGPWLYPAQAKFDRLLRECRVPIGVLTNRREVRLVYAPHGESSGWLSFRVADMATVGGRPILDALVMLLGRERWFGVSAEQQLPALLEQSRRQQADVTTALSGQVFQALEELLAGFATASERDPQSLLREAIERGDGHVYSGLLTLLLRLVFVLYCEDRNLLPLENSLYSKHYSVLGLFEQLERDHGRYPDSMDQRFGAYARLVSLFRAIFLGVQHGDLNLPARQGALFNPNEYPFLEGWRAGSAPTTDEEARAAIALPSVSDGAVFRVLRQLVYLDGQRLSYRALDVEQIGSVYEALMGFDVERLVSGAVRMRVSSKKSAARVWVEGARLLEVPAARREKWLQDELSFDKGLATKVAATTKSAQTADDVLAALEPLSGKARERAGAGSLVIQPGPERRRTSSHYTPRSLSEPIVQKTLDPLIRAMGERPSSDALLSLVICDPAVGSGAFLVAACRYLADHVVAAWTREVAQEPGALPLGAVAGGAASIAGSGKTKLQLVADAHEDVVNHARRLVAQRCLYGVDKNRYAVQLARLSLWLVTMAKNEPFTFVDHAIRHGDSLVGLNFDQIRAFHWKTGQKGEQVETTTLALKDALAEAIDLRRQIQELAADSSPEAQRQKARLFDDAQDALGRVRLVADLVIGAFFAHEKEAARQAERDLRLDLVNAWLQATDLAVEESLRAQLTELQQTLRQTQTPFHWMVEFPEVFYLERPDPLDRMKVNGVAMVDGFVGNPPFLGGSVISTNFGDNYLNWLLASHPNAHGNADLSAHFFRRSAALLGAHGTIGLIATNTIGQGDTRSTGLQYLVAHDFSIVAATVDLPWPGEAAVTVSVVTLAKGAAAGDKRCELDGQLVTAIDSRLQAKRERSDPASLAANRMIVVSLGSRIDGEGFLLDEQEHFNFLQMDPRNRERIRPYMGGQELNTSPTQKADRLVIDFGKLDLEQARNWPALLARVETLVRPARERVRTDTGMGGHGKKYWWQFTARRDPLYAAIAPLSRCLVTSRHSKHLMFAFQPVDRIFSDATNVFAFGASTAFAVLQSRIHEFWARLLSSTMEDRLRYAASDCFETFPFPTEDPRALVPELEALGEQLYNARAAYMVDTDQGLTKTYNALKDPACLDERILALRILHERLDAAVLAAYGWADVAVPPYCVATDADRAALQAFEDEIIDRLFVLNAERAKKEAALGRGKAPKATAAAAPRKPKGDAPAAAKRAKKAPKESPPSGQGNLGWD